MFILVTLIEFVVSDKFERLICEDYNIVNIYMIGWFISTIKVGDYGFKYLCIMKYTKLDYCNKVYHIKLLLYDKILHSLFIIDS